MYSKTKILTILCCLLLSPVTTKAHAPDQINYIFEEDERGGRLTIHFTPQGAIDLITSLKPELAKEPIIKLKNYYDEFTAYFNRTIDLKVGGKRPKLIFKKGNLIPHDATMVYQLSGTPRFHGDFKISIASFIEIYRYTRNHVTVNLANRQEKCVLDRSRKTCSFDLPQYTPGNQQLTSFDKNTEDNSNPFTSWIGGLSLVLIGLAVFVIMKYGIKRYFQ